MTKRNMKIEDMVKQLKKAELFLELVQELKNEMDKFDKENKEE